MISDKTRNIPIDPTLPRWLCQNCRHSLCIHGADSYADRFHTDRSVHGTGSVSASTRMDHSFVVLHKQKVGIPPRPRGGPVQADNTPPAKAMEESFVVLPPAAASMYNSESTINGSGGNQGVSPGGALNSALQNNNNNNVGFHASITVLTRAFDIATTQTQVEQPLCLECMRVLSDKLDKEVEDVNRDIKEYEACLQGLEGSTQDVSRMLVDEPLNKLKCKITNGHPLNRSS